MGALYTTFLASVALAAQFVQNLNEAVSLNRSETEANHWINNEFCEAGQQ